MTRWLRSQNAKLEPLTNSLRHGLVEAISDVIIAVLIAFTIYAIGLRHTAENFSQRLLTHWLPGGALGPHPGERPSVWAFVDIGPDICKHGSIHQGLCPPDTLVTDDKTLADIVHDVRQKNPHVVVLNISSAGAINGRSDAPPYPGENLAMELSRDGPPVLIAWSVDPEKMQKPSSGIASINLSDSQAAALTAPMPYARFLPALIDSHSSFLLPWFEYSARSGTGAIASLSFGAALVAHTDRSAPFVKLDAIARGPSMPDGDFVNRACLPEASVACLKSYSDTERIYSFPGQIEKRQHPDLPYLYITPSLVRPSGLNIDLKDAVVIIGNSNVEDDQYDTPVGRMSGAELQINDIRQFALTLPIGHVPVWRMIWDERPFFLAGFLVSLIIYTVGHSLMGRCQVLRPSRFKAALKAMFDGAVTLLLTVVGSCMAFAAVIYFGFAHLTSSHDFIVPFVGLAGERIFNLGQNITNVCRLFLGKIILPSKKNHEGGRE